MNNEKYTKIVCTVAITVVRQYDASRSVHSQIIGQPADLAVALQIAGEQNKALKLAIIAVAEKLVKQP